MEFDGEDTIAGLEARGWPPSGTGWTGSVVASSSPGDWWQAIAGISCSTSPKGSRVGLARHRFRRSASSSTSRMRWPTRSPAPSRWTRRWPSGSFAITACPRRPSPSSPRPKRSPSVELSPPLFVKPYAEGSSKGVTGRSYVPSLAELGPACAELIAAFRQPVLVERYLPGREFTVGVVGNGREARTVAVMEVLITAGAETHSYTALNKDEYLDRVTYRLIDGEPLADACRTVALGAYHALGCRDAARVDVRCNEHGVPCFLEANPLPGLHHVRSDLPIMARLSGHGYGELLTWIVDAARRRCGLQ